MTDSLSLAYPHLKASKHILDEDHISQLPDEILVSIVSLLTIVEAATTSILSRRWRYLWTYVSRLDFDELSFKLKCPNIELQKYLKLEPKRYVRWVRDVVRSHRGSSLDSFKAIVYHRELPRAEVYELIHFAISKRIEILDLEFYHPYKEFCDVLYRCVGSDPCGLSWIKPLKILKLVQANVTGDLVKFLLSSCPHLIHLEVEFSPGLINLTIDHNASLPLKHLGISLCNSLKSVKVISAPNLVSFFYHGHEIEFYLENAPSLVQVSLGSVACNSLHFAFASLAEFLSRLEWLKLCVNMVDGGYNLRFSHGVLTELKHLTLKVEARRGESLLDITDLIEASPSLRKFTLELTPRRCSPKATMEKNRHKCPHYNLKEVEFIGFEGMRADFELGQYLLENAVALDRFLVNVNHLSCVGQPWENDETKYKVRARKRAKKLEEGLHRKIDFQIVN